MSPENAVDSWCNWGISLRTRPVIIRPLSGGRSNHSYLLESDGKKMALRLNGTESALPGANRNSEFSIWQAASVQGIAPTLLHVDDKARFLVSAFIDNDLPSQPPLNNVLVDRAFDLLKRCHQLDVEAPCIDYAEHIEKYWQIIESQGRSLDPVLNKQREPMHLLLEELTNSGSQTGICHHDPVIENFVGGTDRLYLIDWEYAAQGLVIMDYAALGVEWGIESQLIVNQTGIRPELMTMATSLYRYLCKLWETVTA